jgi:hypothetical protein
MDLEQLPGAGKEAHERPFVDAVFDPSVPGLSECLQTKLVMTRKSLC